VKGGWLGAVEVYPSEMAQNFWTAIYAFTACFVLTIAISLVTRPRPDRELVGLVYSLTDKPEEHGVAWYAKPAPLGLAVLGLTLVLSVIFW
jgi:SSS family solute:Na+ symporter